MFSLAIFRGRGICLNGSRLKPMFCSVVRVTRSLDLFERGQVYRYWGS